MKLKPVPEDLDLDWYEASSGEQIAKIEVKINEVISYFSYLREEIQDLKDRGR